MKHAAALLALLPAVALSEPHPFNAHDLVMLDRISRTDPLRPEADRLKAIVQRDALAAAGVPLDQEKGSAR